MFNFLIQNFSGSSRSMIPLAVPEISPCDGFCDVQQQQEEELGILVVGLEVVSLLCEPGAVWHAYSALPSWLRSGCENTMSSFWFCWNLYAHFYRTQGSGCHWMRHFVET